jgi:hypothetical protein
MILSLQRFLSEQIYNSFVYLLGWQENVLFFSLKGKAVISMWWKQRIYWPIFFCLNASFVQERRLWVPIYGVPIRTWNVALFSKAISSCGCLLCVDRSTKDKSHFDFARVVFDTKFLDLINFTKKILIDGLFFTLQTVEDLTICLWRMCFRWKMMN